MISALGMPPKSAPRVSEIWTRFREIVPAATKSEIWLFVRQSNGLSAVCRFREELSEICVKSGFPM